MMSGKMEEKGLRADAERRLARHVSIPQPCFSRRFSKAGGSLIDSFTVTWVPGAVVLTGDWGELSIVHPPTLRDLRTGMEWLASGSYEYLMSKAQPRAREFDREATYGMIVRAANAEAGDEYRYVRGERRRYRAEVARAIEEGWRHPTSGDYRLALPSARPGAVREVPTGFRLWHLIAEEIYGGHPHLVYSASGRRRLRDALKARLGDGGRESAADFCRYIGFDEYGSERFPLQSVMQIEALRHAARSVLVEMAEQEKSVVSRLLRAVRSLLWPGRRNRLSVSHGATA